MSMDRFWRADDMSTAAIAQLEAIINDADSPTAERLLKWADTWIAPVSVSWMITSELAGSSSVAERYRKHGAKQLGEIVAGLCEIKTKKDERANRTSIATVYVVTATRPEAKEINEGRLIAEAI